MIDAITAIVDYALLVALILALFYIFGPQIRKMLRRREDIARSFGGGVAAAYVFLHLFPELERAHEFVGDYIHFVTLVSFLLLFTIELSLQSRNTAASPNASLRYVFWLHVGLAWISTWLIVFALPDDMQTSIIFALVGSLAVGIHLLYKDYILRTHYTQEYDSAGTFVLALAPLAGWFSLMVAEPSEAVADLVIAVLAGLLLHNVFRNELPSHEGFRYRWFIGGVAVYALLVTITP